ncbi:NRDE family protein [Dokdonella sp.]|uniref:NRDE family protein n=1 Tax=Dokdonella sp. TaxID=2291710 RepID=UPI003C3A0B19
MCILLIAIDTVLDWPLLLLGNRDEFHPRPSLSAQPWRGAGDCLGGLDLVGGGSWLAQRNDGRFAAVTNLRNGLPAQAPRSRGMLVRDFVTSNQPPEQFAQRVLSDIGLYGGFNLVFGDRSSVWLIDGSTATVQRLPAGVHVVSNGPYAGFWPKSERLRTQFMRTVNAGWRDDASLLALLADTRVADDAELPDTGVGLERERLLSPIFIRGEHYGTRASSLVMRHEDGTLHFRERSFAAHGTQSDEVTWVCPSFDSEWRLDDGAAD